ncbi:uncharacterized protein LDX57_011448 [Aspergillus melleus]|uniref:uncharacterized protein n=1 Tax=Aspergillus melleus TaxID=138277 RepID=UPI001E8E03FE|nr:uncharacterized protein LDX57_011448 [Aspergillus melleus]KAH8433814.1 hypothetical protein LDX57_011448 [Aspergillus melleus]
MAYPPLHLAQIINIHPNHDAQCIGWAKTAGRRCRLVASAASRAEASDLLEQANKQLYAGYRIDEILESIAFLLLCRRWHQDQAPAVSGQWKAQIYRYFAAAAAAVQAPPVAQVWHKRDHDVEVSLPISNLRDSPPIYLHSDREQISRSQLQVQAQAQTQVQPHRDTCLPIQPNSSFTHSSSTPPSVSTEANAEPETDPSSEMFARTSRPRRVVMPTRLNHTKVHPEAIIKRDSQGISSSTSTYGVKASSSTSAPPPPPIPKVNRSITASPSRQYFEDRTRMIDAYMQKLRRMEPPEDDTDFEEATTAQKEEQKASLLRELKAIVPARERPSASSVVAPIQKQTALLEGVVVEERKTKRVVDEYMDGVRLMDYGGDETDSEEDVGEMKEKVKGALVAQIKQIGLDIRRAGDEKSRTHASNKMAREVKVEIEESPLTSKPADIVRPVPIHEDAVETSTKTAKEIDINVNVDINKPTTQLPDVTTIIQPIEDEKKVSIITDIHEMADDESEDLASTSPHSSPSSASSSSSSSTHSFPSPYSSTSSLESLKRSSELLSMALQEPPMKNHIIINNNDDKKNNNNPTPHLHTNQLQEPLPINTKHLTLPQPIKTPSTNPLPNNKHPPNPYPTLTTGLAIGIALFDGLAWLLDKKTLSVCVGFGVYIKVLAVVGML